MRHLLVPALIVWLPVLSAAAESTAVVAVGDCSRDRSAGSARLLRAALSVRSGLNVQSEEETLAPLGGPVRGSVEDAERLLESARMYFNEEFGPGGKTTKALDEAMAILKALPTSEPRRWQAICDVASLQAQVIYMRNKAEAELPLEPILRVNPYFQVDKERYSPDIWAVTDKARSRVKAHSVETLKVTTRPGSVPVYIDGRNMGKAPVIVKLPTGEYRVEAGFRKERTMARMVQVMRGTTSVELDQAFDGSILTGSGVCVATSGTREGRLRGLIRLAAYLGVNQVVGVWNEEPAEGEEYVAATAVDAGSGQEVREAKVKASKGQVPAGGMEKLAEFISTGSALPPVLPVVGGLNAKASSTVQFAEITPNMPRPGWRVASYITGGAALAALGLGTYGFIAAGSKQRELVKLTGSESLIEADQAKIDKLSSEVKRKKALGFVSIGVGVAATGAAIGCYLYSSSQPSGSETTIGLTPNMVYVSFSF